MVKRSTSGKNGSRSTPRALKSNDCNKSIDKENIYPKTQKMNIRKRSVVHRNVTGPKITEIVHRLFATHGNIKVCELSKPSGFYPETDGKGKGNHRKDGKEMIPSNEELFAIGWAKAYDKERKCYYYYTLDRSRVVWDNPLS